MDERRLQDQIDACRLVSRNPELDLDAVRQNLGLIADRGYSRGQDLHDKLAGLLAFHESSA